MGRRRGEAKRIKPGSKPTKITLYTEDVDSNDAKDEAPMRPRKGEPKRIKPGSKPTKVTLYTEDVDSNDAKDEAPIRPRKSEPKRIKPGSKPAKVTLYSEDADHHADAKDETHGNSPNALDGELPLFGTSPKLIRNGHVGTRIRKLEEKQDKASRKGGGDRSDVSADVHLGGHVDSGWPLQNQEIATWASSFRFDLDSRRLQAMLEREAQSSGTPSGSFRSTPGGSFRFRNGPEEGGNGLKPPPPPRQIENKPVHQSSSHGLIESQEVQGGDGDGDAEISREDWSIVPIEACKNVAVDVPNSPERSVILQRLRELKTQSVASPPFGLEDDASYHKELAKLTVGRGDGLDQWLNASSPLRRSNIQSSSHAPVKAEPPRKIVTATVMARRKPINSRESPRRTGPQSVREVSSTTPTDSRFNNNANNNNNISNNSKENIKNSSSSSSGSSLQEQILSITKQSLNVSSPSPHHTHFLPASIPIQWEDQRGKPKTIRLSRGLSREATEFIKYMENLPPTEAIAINANATSSSSPEGGIGGNGIGDGDGARAESHRYYGRVRHSRETSLGQSSRRYSTNEKLEAQIDLDASAAAKFLVEQYDTPLSTPGRQGSSPAFAVPFKWEDAPGKAKASSPATISNSLQLPPRLAVVPSYRSSDSFGRDLRASHPFAGFFAPCMTASSPGQQQQRDRKQSDRLEPSKSLPPRAPSPPPERRRRAGLVGRCSSLPQQGCQISVPRSAASSPVTIPMGIDSACNPSPNSNPNVPSSPTSILHGPDGSSSQTSASNLAFSSCDLDDFTRKTSKSSSFASIEEDFTELPKASGAPALKTDPQRSRLRGASTTSASRNGDSGTSTSTSLNAPTATGARNCDPTTSSTSTLPSPGASTSRNCDVEIRPVYEPISQGEISCASPKRPTRLPYTMPSVAEQMLASCNDSTRRHLIQDLSPRLMRPYSGRRLTRSSNTQTGNTPAAEEAYPSPAYAAALELLSPAMAQRRKGRSPARPTLVAKPRRRPRFMLSICRTLKRVVLGRKRRCKPVVEPKLMMYCDAIAPTTFQFSKPN